MLILICEVVAAIVPVRELVGDPVILVGSEGAVWG